MGIIASMPELKLCMKTIAIKEVQSMSKKSSNSNKGNNSSKGSQGKGGGKNA
jgi:hypothetical protein